MRGYDLSLMFFDNAALGIIAAVEAFDAEEYSEAQRHALQAKKEFDEYIEKAAKTDAAAPDADKAEAVQALKEMAQSLTTLFEKLETVDHTQYC